MSLNALRKRKSSSYPELAWIVQEFRNIASGNPTPNDLSSDEAKKLALDFKEKRLGPALVNGEYIFASDRRTVLALAVMRLNSRLAKYLSYPYVRLETKGKWKGRWELQRESPSFSGDIVHQIVSLAEHDLLKRVRECKQCKDWFYANRIMKQFCSKKCAKLHWNTSPNGKAALRPYMREYMREWRKKNL